MLIYLSALRKMLQILWCLSERIFDLFRFQRGSGPVLQAGRDRETTNHLSNLWYKQVCKDLWDLMNSRDSITREEFRLIHSHLPPTILIAMISGCIETDGTNVRSKFSIFFVIIIHFIDWLAHNIKLDFLVCFPLISTPYSRIPINPRVEFTFSNK